MFYISEVQLQFWRTPKVWVFAQIAIQAGQRQAQWHRQINGWPWAWTLFTPDNKPFNKEWHGICVFLKIWIRTDSMLLQLTISSSPIFVDCLLVKYWYRLTSAHHMHSPISISNPNPFISNNIFLLNQIQNNFLKLDLSLIGMKYGIIYFPFKYACPTSCVFRFHLKLQT